MLPGSFDLFAAQAVSARSMRVTSLMVTSGRACPRVAAVLRDVGRRGRLRRRVLAFRLLHDRLPQDVEDVYRLISGITAATSRPRAAWGCGSAALAIDELASLSPLLLLRFMRRSPA